MPYFRKGLGLKKTEITNIPLGGLWERKECFRAKLHLNSLSVVFMSEMPSPVWGWFYYEMKTVNIKIGHKLQMSYNSTGSSLSEMCNFSLSGCLCWHWRRLGSAKDDPPVGPLFNITDQLFDETGWTGLLFSYHVKRDQLSSQLCVLPFGRMW